MGNEEEDFVLPETSGLPSRGYYMDSSEEIANTPSDQNSPKDMDVPVLPSNVVMFDGLPEVGLDFIDMDQPMNSETELDDEEEPPQSENLAPADFEPPPSTSRRLCVGVLVPNYEYELEEGPIKDDDYIKAAKEQANKKNKQLQDDASSCNVTKKLRPRSPKNQPPPSPPLA